MTTSQQSGQGTAATETGLTKAIRLPQATAMVVGIIIGAAIFMQPSQVTGDVPSVPAILLVWIIAGILTVFGALVCAELASVFPRSGGVYVFLRESFGNALGFLWAWAMFWTMHTGIIAAIATGFARYAGTFLPLGDAGTRLVAVAVILVISGINLLGVRQGANLQTFFTAGKLIAIAAIIVLGFALGGGITDSALQGGVMAADRAITFRDYLLALVAGLFAYGGWHMVTYAAGETTDATRTIPRALIIGVAIVTVCYILLNLVYLYVMPLETVAQSTRLAADAAERVMGPAAGRVISALVMFSTFGAVAGVILAGPRVYYAMARDGLLFKWFGELSGKNGTPSRAIVLQAVWACVLAGTGTYGQLVSQVIYTEWIFFGLMAVGLIVLRRRGAKRTYSIPGYPFVPIIFALSAFTIAVNEIISKPGPSMRGLGMVLVGLPVYFIWTSITSRRAQPT